MPAMIILKLHHLRWLQHVWLPLIVFAALAVLLETSRFDLWLADHIYAWSGNAWSMRNSWVARDVIHDGGRTLVALMAIGLLLLTIASCFLTRLQRWRRGLGYLLVSVLVSGVTVNLLKEFTHVDCPWDLLRYGGDFPYVRNFSPHPATFRFGSCFPAGHASAAYAWLGLYYFCHEYAPRWKSCVLGGVLVAGLVFGVGQQLRGAHFISHDLWTLAICWFVATATYGFFGYLLTTTPGPRSSLRACGE